MTARKFTTLVRGLPFTVPFVGPSELERRRGREFDLRLGANENLFGCSPAVTEALARAAETVGYYPDPTLYQLRSALASRYSVDIANILVASGIDELLGLIVRAFLEPGDVAVTTTGTYPTFNYHVHGYGGRIETVPYRGTKVDLDGLVAAAHEKQAKLVYLANPDNPSGSFHGREAIRRMRASLPDSAVLILDEAYIEFAPPEEQTIEPFGDDILQLRTFSKVYGLAGLRIGFALADTELIRTFDKLRLHFGVSSFAQAAAVAALGDHEFVRSVVERTAEGHALFRELAHELGIGIIPSSTNFVLLDMGTAEASKTMLSMLAEHHVFVRRPSTGELARYIRVTVGTREQCIQFMQIFRTLFKEFEGR